jgi:hypothetical protein
MCANSHWSSVTSAGWRRVISGLYGVWLLLLFRPCIRRRIVLVLVWVLRFALWTCIGLAERLSFRLGVVRIVWARHIEGCVCKKPQCCWFSQLKLATRRLGRTKHLEGVSLWRDRPQMNVELGRLGSDRTVGSVASPLGRRKDSRKLGGSCAHRPSAAG